MSETIILIAGATGKNGRTLIKNLELHKLTIRAFVRDRAKAKDLVGEKTELVEGDLNNLQSLEAAMQGVNTAYFAASISSRAVTWFENFIEAASKNGVSRIVKLSGLGAHHFAKAEILRQHAATDRFLQESGLNYTIIRPNSFHQNVLDMAGMISELSLFTVPINGARQSFIDVRDIAEATAKIITEPGHVNKVYELTGPEALSYHEIAKTLSEIAGRKIDCHPINSDVAETNMRLAGLLKWQAHAVAELQTLFATGAYSFVTPDLQRILGRPGRTFREFARDYEDIFSPVLSPA